MPPKKKKKGQPPACQSREYQIIRDRIDAFELTGVQEKEGCVIDSDPKLYTDLKLYGVVVFNPTKKKDAIDRGEKRFFCLAAASCASEKKSLLLSRNTEVEKGWVTSNPVTHLQGQHGIYSEKSSNLKKKARTEEEERHEMKVIFKNNKTRLCELSWVKMVILTRQTFSFPIQKVVRDLMHYSCIPEMNVKLSVPRLIHIATEIYGQVLCVVKGMITNAIDAHGSRIFSLNIDGWKAKHSTRKFTGVRLYFLDPAYTMKTALLAVREFTPSSKMRGSDKGLRTATRVWARGILDTYGLDFNNIFGATTDGGSDMRILASHDIGANREWCPPHMINRVLFFAFGDRNLEMQAEISAMRALIVTIRDHTKDGNIFEETRAEVNPDVGSAGLHMYNKQRFMGIFLTLQSFHSLFETIDAMCKKTKCKCTCTLTKLEVEQLLSLLAPLSEISVKSQEQKKAYGYRILFKLSKERLEGSLNFETPLKRFDDATKVFASLTPRVAKTQKLLIEGMDTKHFSRYFRKDESGVELQHKLLMEAQTVLHPALRSLEMVNEVIEELVQTDSAALGPTWWKKTKLSASQSVKRAVGKVDKASQVKQFIFQAKKNYIKQSQRLVAATVKSHIVDYIVESDPDGNIGRNPSASDVPSVPETYVQPSLDFCSMEQDMLNERGAGPDVRSRPQSSTILLRQVENQYDAYLEAEKTMPEFLNIRIINDLATWINTFKKFKYGYIVRGMAAYFGVPTSSAGIELDFYVESLLWTKQRMSMRGEVAEMFHAVDRNRELISFPQVDILNAADAKKLYPCFVGDDHAEIVDDREEENQENESDIEIGNLFDIDSDEENEAAEQRKQKRERMEREKENRKQESEAYCREQQSRREQREAEETRNRKEQEAKAKSDRSRQEQTRRERQRDDLLKKAKECMEFDSSESDAKQNEDEQEFVDNEQEEAEIDEIAVEVERLRVEKEEYIEKVRYDQEEKFRQEDLENEERQEAAKKAAASELRREQLFAESENGQKKNQDTLFGESENGQKKSKRMSVAKQDDVDTCAQNARERRENIENARNNKRKKKLMERREMMHPTPDVQASAFTMIDDDNLDNGLWGTGYIEQESSSECDSSSNTSGCSL